MLYYIIHSVVGWFGIRQTIISSRIVVGLLTLTAIDTHCLTFAPSTSNRR